MRIYSQRARGFGFPEQSVRAIRAALASRADGIAIDAWLTKDLKWAVCAGISRRTEEARVRRLHSRTLAALGEDALSLETVLALFSALGDGKELLLSAQDKGEERALLALLRASGAHDRIVLLAWERETLRRAHRLDPSLRLGLSYSPTPLRRAGAGAKVHRPLSRKGVQLRYNARHSFDAGLSLRAAPQEGYFEDLEGIPLASVQAFAGFGVHHKLAGSLLKRRGVDGLITDAPALFFA